MSATLHPDTHARLRAAILKYVARDAPDCYPKTASCGDCNPYWWCNVNDALPTTPCGCEGLAVIVGDVTHLGPGGNGNSAAPCWTREQQRFTILHTKTWPFGVEPCQTDEINTAIIAMNECRCAVRSAILKVTWEDLGFKGRLGGPKCGPIRLDDTTRCWGPSGACFGFTLGLTVGI